jgi:C-terminal processing protease CtpA/Prc
MNLRSFLIVLSGIVIISSCRKNDAVGDKGDSQDDKLKDSAVAIARDIYLWNTQIPSDFDGQSYDDPDKIMMAIRQYSQEPGFADPVDHYSFGIKKSEWNNVSSGIASDFGLNAFFFSDNDLRVRSVVAGSPAGMAGIRRGWKMVKVAGSSDINADNADFLSEKIYGSPSTSFTFEKPDGSDVDITLQAAIYQDNPIYLDTIYNAGSKKAGYLVFNSFLGDTAVVKAKFQQIFQEFADKGVTDMIVDLRYNGGGYVDLQATLANYLVKSAADGSIMMNEEFNSNYTALNTTAKFKKLGPLNINNVFFIVSENTASASELLINNLKPYMNVKLVGPEATYGKPVGFFPIGVGDWYVFPVSFRSTNGLGSGNYFDGIAVDNVAPDGLDRDWGDSNESSLASVLQYISSGSFAVRPISRGLNSTLETFKSLANSKLNKRFIGAIENSK